MTAATCLADATATYKCADCDETTVKAVPDTKLSHSYTGEVKKNDDGTHSFLCVNGCGEYGPAEECDYESVVTAPTCTEGGYTTHTCAVCGYSYTDAETPANGHSYRYTPGEDGTHVVTCANCDLNATEAHVDGTPVIENEVAAACDNPGRYDTVVYCERCGAELSRETHTVTKDHTPAQPVKEHEVAVTCTTDGSYEIVVRCVDCGAELSRESRTVTATGHKWADGVTTAATCTREGKTVYTCKVCGETKEETLAINPNNHAGGTEVRGKAEATKEQDGYTGDTYCKGCGELLKQGKVVTYQEGECPYCSGHHTGLLGAIITAIHGIVWLFHKAFGLGNPFTK